MSGQAAIIVSFIIYLAFFGWLGFRRGIRRETIVFAVGALALLLLGEQSDVVVNIANLFGAAFSFATAGGFSGSADEAFAALANAPELVSADSRAPFFFVGWSLLFVATYAVTQSPFQTKTAGATVCRFCWASSTVCSSASFLYRGW